MNFQSVSFCVFRLTIFRPNILSVVKGRIKLQLGATPKIMLLSIGVLSRVARPMIAICNSCLLMLPLMTALAAERDLAVSVPM